MTHLTAVKAVRITADHLQMYRNCSVNSTPPNPSLKQVIKQARIEAISSKNHKN